MKDQIVHTGHISKETAYVVLAEPGSQNSTRTSYWIETRKGMGDRGVILIEDLRTGRTRSERKHKYTVFQFLCTTPANALELVVFNFPAPQFVQRCFKELLADIGPTKFTYDQRYNLRKKYSELFILDTVRLREHYDATTVGSFDDWSHKTHRHIDDAAFEQIADYPDPPSATGPNATGDTPPTE